MEQQTKYYDVKKVLGNKEKITVLTPQYIYDDIQYFSKLIGGNTTEVVNEALYQFFRYKIVTNDYLLGYGDLYFNLPLNKEFKDNAIANKIKLNQDREPNDMTEPILIKTVTNNLDVFNGVTFSANLDNENINHIGIDFKIIHSENIINEMAKFPITDIALTDFLFVFYYEVSNTNSIDVYLINPIDAVNRLSSVNHSLGNSLIECLQEMEILQKKIKELYHSEMQELQDDNKTAISDSCIEVLTDALTELSKKYDNQNIIYGVDLLKYNNIKQNSIINQLKIGQDYDKRILKRIINSNGQNE